MSVNWRLWVARLLMVLGLWLLGCTLMLGWPAVVLLGVLGLCAGSMMLSSEAWIS